MSANSSSSYIRDRNNNLRSPTTQLSSKDFKNILNHPNISVKQNAILIKIYIVCRVPVPYIKRQFAEKNNPRQFTASTSPYIFKTRNPALRSSISPARKRDSTLCVLRTRTSVRYTRARARAWSRVYIAAHANATRPRGIDDGSIDRLLRETSCGS